MASYITIARPYAKALFEYASQHAQVDAWLEALSILAITLSQPVIEPWLDSPLQSQQNIAELLLDVLKSVAPKRADELGVAANNFLALLAEAKRMVILPDISRAFHFMHAGQAGMVEADVVSATSLDEQQREQLRAKLEQRFGSKVELNFSEDSQLMGSMVITAGNWVMDGSIQSKIARLNEVLTT